MKKLRIIKKYLLAIILLSFTSNPLWAANQNSVNENFATINSSGNAVSWSIHPSVHYESITLKLSPSNGNTIVVTSTGEPSTGYLADGQYDYEIVVTPALGSAIRNELKAARKAAGGQETSAAINALKNQGKIPQHRQVQSGHFTILNGQYVSPNAVEK